MHATVRGPTLHHADHSTSCSKAPLCPGLSYPSMKDKTNLRTEHKDKNKYETWSWTKSNTARGNFTSKRLEVLFLEPTHWRPEAIIPGCVFVPETHRKDWSWISFFTRPFFKAGSHIPVRTGKNSGNRSVSYSTTLKRVQCMRCYVSPLGFSQKRAALLDWRRFQQISVAGKLIHFQAGTRQRFSGAEAVRNSELENSMGSLSDQGILGMFWLVICDAVAVLWCNWDMLWHIKSKR